MFKHQSSISGPGEERDPRATHSTVADTNPEHVFLPVTAFRSHWKISGHVPPPRLSDGASDSRGSGDAADARRSCASAVSASAACCSGVRLEGLQYQQARSTRTSCTQGLTRTTSAWAEVSQLGTRPPCCACASPSRPRAWRITVLRSGPRHAQSMLIM